VLGAAAEADAELAGDLPLYVLAPLGDRI